MGTAPGRRYGRNIARILFPLIVIISCIFFSPPAFAQDPPYCEELLEAARRQKLHDDRYWHILMHYQQRIIGIESLIDDPNFFLAPDGKTNPVSELEATIRAFFAPADNENASAVCRFAARFEWLTEKLGIDTGRLPVPACRSFENFMEANRPSSVTLAFPMAHLNSPASMFGHTLLFIETADRSKLLSYSVSYSAVTNETFGPFFAVKGLFGMYPGYFAVLPYYAKLQQYSDVDHRDIWEYRLNLTEPEIRRMLLHIRELESIASDYYFFQENCSYLLYFLLEAARPSLELSQRFHGWLIPLDSIRAIQEQGLITEASYRPSRTTKIRHLASNLDGHGQEKALALAKGDVQEGTFSQTDLSVQEQRTICELAGEYLQFLYTKRRVPEETYQERFLRILQMRSALGISSENGLSRAPVPLQPDRGHHSNRVSLGAGIKGDDAFAEIRIRPAYHHLMDYDGGYVEGAQLVFADVALRYRPEDRRLFLERLDVIDIFSLSPRDRFFRPISWKLSTGLFRVEADHDKDRLVYRINPGAGFAFGNNTEGLIYTMLETNINIGVVLEKNYSAGMGGSAGAVGNLCRFWKVHAFVRDIYYSLGDTRNFFEAAVHQNFVINPDQSVSIEVCRSRTHDIYQTEAKALWNLFF